MRITILVVLLAATAVGAERRTMTCTELRGRIEGGWAGQMIGVSFGAPTEFRFNRKAVPPGRLKWSPEMVSQCRKYV